MLSRIIACKPIIFCKAFSSIFILAPNLAPSNQSIPDLQTNYLTVKALRWSVGSGMYRDICHRDSRLVLYRLHATSTFPQALSSHLHVR